MRVGYTATVVNAPALSRVVVFTHWEWIRPCRIPAAVFLSKPLLLKEYTEMEGVASRETPTKGVGLSSQTLFLSGLSTQWCIMPRDSCSVLRIAVTSCYRADGDAYTANERSSRFTTYM